MARLTNLEVLYLCGTETADAGLVTIGNMPKLQWLDLRGTNVTDAGLAHLSKLSRLRLLCLYGVRVTDAGVARLTELANLEVLTLNFTQLTDAGLRPLMKLPKLSDVASPSATILLEGLNPAPQPQGSASIDIGTEYSLTCTVVASENRVAIEIRRDDQVLFQWAGLVSQVAEGKTMRPGTVQLQTAYYTSSRFTDLRLRMLSGRATPLFPTVSESDPDKTPKQP